MVPTSSLKRLSVRVTQLQWPSMPCLQMAHQETLGCKPRSSTSLTCWGAPFPSWLFLSTGKSLSSAGKLVTSRKLLSHRELSLSPLSFLFPRKLLIQLKITYRKRSLHLLLTPSFSFSGKWYIKMLVPLGRGMASSFLPIFAKWHPFASWTFKPYCLLLCWRF